MKIPWLRNRERIRKIIYYNANHITYLRNKFAEYTIDKTDRKKKNLSDFKLIYINAITFANNCYPDVILARKVDSRFLGRLTPEHLRAMCQTIDDYLPPSYAKYFSPRKGNGRIG